MKKLRTLIALLCMIAIAGIVKTAFADSSDAMCEFYKDRVEKPNRTGPCTFSQRQGYIDIDLRNGDNFSLAPSNKPDHFKDQHGNKVERTQATRNTHTYKWENKKIIVKFPDDTSREHNREHGHHGHHEPVSLNDLEGARASSADTALNDRGFRRKGGYQEENKIVATWYNSRTRQCVEIVTKEGHIKHIKDIDEGNCL